MVCGQPGPHSINAQHGLDMDVVLDHGDNLPVEAQVFRRLATTIALSGT